MKNDKNELDVLMEEESAEETYPANGDTIRIQLKKSKVTSTVFDWLGSLFMALICVLIVMTFFFRVIDVDGPSMESTLINTDKVVITDLFYTPHQGDIVVISHGEKYDKALIKRVIATEGQTISIKENVAFVDGKPLEGEYVVKDNKVYVNKKPLDGNYVIKNYVVFVDGEPLEEDYIQGLTRLGDRPTDETIPEGKVFVMGDNRTVSLDSRFQEVGLINVSDIIGKAQLDIIPHTYDENGNLKLDLSKIRYLYD